MHHSVTGSCGISTKKVGKCNCGITILQTRIVMRLIGATLLFTQLSPHY